MALDTNKLRHSLELIISNHLESEHEQVGPLWRLFLLLNRWRIRVCLSKFQGFNLTRPIETVQDQDDGLTFAKRWQRFKRQESSSKFYRLVLASLLLSTALAAMNLYFHYCYDFNLALLREIDCRRAEGAANHTDLALEAQRRAQSARAWLKFLGSAHVEWRFVAQIIHVVYWFYALMFVAGTAYARFRDQDHFSWLRWVLDAASECKSRARLTLDEMAKVQRAMILSAEIEFEQLEELALGISDSSRFDPRRHGPQFRDESRDRRRMRSSYVLANIGSPRNWIMGRHQMALEQFARVALAGRLNPLNRTRRSISSLETTMCIADSTQNGLLIAHAFFAYHHSAHILARNGAHVEYSSFRDHLQALNFAYPVLLCHIVVVPVTSFNLAVGFDQAQSAARLELLILETICANEAIYREMNKTRRPEARNCLGTKLEQNLMTALLHYRLFASEHELALRPYQYFGAIYFSLIFMIAILFRSHSPYLLDDTKLFAFFNGLFATLPTLFYFLPLCHVHRKCTRAYKQLNSLLAQSIEYAPIWSPTQSAILQDIQTQLRRELSEPKESLIKSPCRVFTQEITYASMLKMIFWVGLIQLPTLSRSKQDDIMGEFLADPFGIFRALDCSSKP